MIYSIGQVAKLFGISVESIVYYEKEGLIHPSKNPNNGYREFTINDIVALSDILFYRNVDISIKEITEIQSGMDMKGISELIDNKITEINDKILTYKRLLSKLKSWSVLHNADGINMVGRFDIREMPVAIRPKDEAEGLETDIVGFIEKFHDYKDMIYYLFYAFEYDVFFGQGLADLRRYVVLDSGDNELPEILNTDEYELESCKKCIYTVVRFTGDADEMFGPITKYAEDNGISLSGRLFGRLSIVNYENCRYTEFYRVYAEIN